MRLLADHLRRPLHRNAYALIASTGLTSGLGFIYWVTAARLYPPEVVGQSSAALSSMMFLAGLAQFGSASVLIRFIRPAGPAAPVLTRRITVMASVASLVAGSAFVLGTGLWAPSLGFLRTSPLLGLCFALSTATWGVFVLHEAILTGLRMATWVPIRNTAFSLGKIALLVVFAATLPSYGILASWIIPAGLAVVPVGLLIRRQFVNARVSGRQQEVTTSVRSQVVPYAFAEYAASLFWLAATMLMPILVTEVAGPAANARFYVAWTIAYTLYLVTPGVGSSLIVESVIDPDSLRDYARRAFLQAASIVLPLVGILFLAAPHILGLVGDGYAAEGTTLLRLLALSALPNLVVALYTSVARARRQVGVILSILAAQCISVLVLSSVLLPLAGISGVGLAWLISQTAIAGVLLVSQFLVLKRTGSTANAGRKIPLGRLTSRNTSRIVGLLKNAMKRYLVLLSLGRARVDKG